MRGNITDKVQNASTTQKSVNLWMSTGKCPARSDSFAQPVTQAPSTFATSTILPEPSQITTTTKNSIELPPSATDPRFIHNGEESTSSKPPKIKSNTLRSSFENKCPNDADLPVYLSRLPIWLLIVLIVILTPLIFG